MSAPPPASVMTGGEAGSAQEPMADEADLVQAPSVAALDAPGAASRSEEPTANAPARSAAPGHAAKHGLTHASNGSASPPNSPEERTSPEDRVSPKLAYQASLDLSVRELDADQAAEQIIDIAYKRGGFLAGRSSERVDVRIPSERFRAAMHAIDAIGQVTNRRVDTQDVTEAFHDAEVRLANLRATRKRLEEFLARAKNIEEALRVERELERVAQSIDLIEGKLRALKDRVTYARISVRVHVQRSTPQPIAPIKPSKPPRVSLPVAWLSELRADRVMDLKR